MKTKSRSIKKEVILDGMPTSPGIAMGPVYIFNPYPINIAELGSEAKDPDQEILLFDRARRRVLEQLKFAKENSEASYGDQFSDIFETQQAFLNDQVLMDEIKKAIGDKAQSAVHVVAEILSQKSDYFINLENTYFRERAFDIIDLKQKLILALVGINIDYQLSQPSIVLAETLSPSDTVHFNRKFILGFLTDKGGKTAHATILARGLRIPAVVNRINLSKLLNRDDFLIIDGFKGTIIINPNDATIEKYQQLLQYHQKINEDLIETAQEKAVTRDGQEIQLLVNIELPNELEYDKNTFADGIGLFRTENIFLQYKYQPDEETQFQIYARLIEKVAPHPVVIRTIDVGGDKMIAGFGPQRELNPYLGWRAIRFCLDRPEIFKTQLRAILRSSVFGNVIILIPMVSTLEEIDQTKALIKEAQEELKLKNLRFNDKVPLGIMVETPAAAIYADKFARHVDYFSIGTNDLTQYVLAIDRTNDRVARYYNSFNPAVLLLMHKTIQAAQKRHIGVSICGEFGAQPEAIALLIGMGLRSFSMSPQFIPWAKKVIRSLDTRQCIDLFKEVKKLDTSKQVEQKCLEFVGKLVPDLNVREKSQIPEIRE